LLEDGVDGEATERMFENEDDEDGRAIETTLGDGRVRGEADSTATRGTMSPSSAVVPLPKRLFDEDATCDAPILDEEEEARGGG
jgi:hypothetical protein